jgi:hypothetical protein
MIKQYNKLYIMQDLQDQLLVNLDIGVIESEKMLFEVKHKIMMLID